MQLSAKMQSTLIHMCECTGVASYRRYVWMRRTFNALEKRGLVESVGKNDYKVTNIGYEVYRELKSSGKFVTYKMS